jgi:hypothetical protein
MALKIDYSLRLPDGQFFPAARKKTGIAIHHTVGGTAFSTVAFWLKDRTRSGKLRMVGTAYIIGRDGTVGIEYFVIPAWFTETFIIDHENAESWREQKDRLLAVDSLRVQVAALQDSVATLHAQNALALQAGYDNASNDYRDLSTRYIAELRKPRFSLGSTVGLCLGAAGAGIIIGTLTQR